MRFRQIAPALTLALTLGAVASASAQIPAPQPVPAPTIPSPLPAAPLPGPTLVPRAGAAQPPGGCTITGTDGSDRLAGTAGHDVICGEGGDDVLEGLEGDDTLDGGSGNDIATWESSACCVFADLSSGTATGGLGADQLVGIESLSGSQGADVLRGDASANSLSGNGTTDLLYGGEGDDSLSGGDGDDWLAGEAGINILDGGDGANVCADASGTSCDPPDPSDPGDVRGPLDVSLVDGSFGGGTISFRVAVRGRMRPGNLWDQGYLAISFDTRGGDEFDNHAVVVWSKRRPSGLLITEGKRSASGKVAVSRSGRSSVKVKVPVHRIGLDPLRLYYRWAARSMFTGPGCRPCLDGVPDSNGYPQPLI